jgi:hypothetical protein
MICPATSFRFLVPRSRPRRGGFTLLELQSMVQEGTASDSFHARWQP